MLTMAQAATRTRLYQGQLPARQVRGGLCPDMGSHVGATLGYQQAGEAGGTPCSSIFGTRITRDPGGREHLRGEAETQCNHQAGP